MFTLTKCTGFGLAFISILICHVNYAHPATYTVLLPRGDSAGSASNSRPVTVEIVNLPPQPAVAPVSAASDTLVSDASAKVEKVLRKPMRFSLNTDQVHQASSHSDSHPQKVSVASTHSDTRIDQQPDAIDYYKYVARLENEEKGGAVKEVREAEDDLDKEGNKDYSSAPVGFHKGEHKHDSKGAVNEDHHEVKSSAHVAHTSDIKGDSHSEDDSSDESDDDNHESSTNDQHKHEVNEDRETSATEHKDDKGDENSSYKKGGGKHHEDGHHDIDDKDGKKSYIGRHHHEDGDVGKHIKEGIDDQFHEDGAHKEADHHDDDYHSEHDHGEEGKKGSDFHEEGEHSQGHSTSGEHNIHKKDEYEKKQEFFDESHEGGDTEKEGDFFHEDDFKKGGHEKSDHDTGAGHESHYGKKTSQEKGAHEHVDVGHDNAKGHAKYHQHEDKGGKSDGHDGSKKYAYGHGEKESDEGGKKDDDNDGDGTSIKEVATKGDHGKAADSEAHGTNHEDVTSGASSSSYKTSYSKGNKAGKGDGNKGHSQGHSSGSSYSTSSSYEGSSGGSYTKSKDDQGGAASNKAEKIERKNKGLGGTGQEKNRYMLVIVDDHNNANSQSAQSNSKQIK